jgi:hypothetical protein
MSDRRGFVEAKIDDIEHEVVLWRQLHEKLSRLLNTKGEDVEDGHGGVVKQVTIPVERGRWKWNIVVDDNRSAIDKVWTNKWGNPLTQMLRINFWLVDDQVPHEEGVTDEPKISIICSPRGVKDITEYRFLEPEEVEKLAYDPILFPVD